MTNKASLKKFSIIGMVITLIIWIALSAVLIKLNVELFGIYLGEVLLFSLAGVPVAFLQLRLCLTDKEKWVRWVPTALALLSYSAALIFHIIYGFEGSLVALLILVFVLTPSAGICLGWLAHGKRLAIIPLNIIFIIYLISNRIPIFTRPIELVDIVAILYHLAGIWLCIRPIERGGENEPEN